MLTVTLLTKKQQKLYYTVGKTINPFIIQHREPKNLKKQAKNSGGEKFFLPIPIFFNFSSTLIQSQRVIHAYPPQQAVLLHLER